MKCLLQARFLMSRTGVLTDLTCCVCSTVGTVTAIKTDKPGLKLCWVLLEIREKVINSPEGNPGTPNVRMCKTRGNIKKTLL